MVQSGINGDKMLIMVINIVLVIYVFINIFFVMLYRFYKLNFSVWLFLCKKEYIFFIFGLNFFLEGSQLFFMEQFVYSLIESGLILDLFF